MIVHVHVGARVFMFARVYGRARVHVCACACAACGVRCVFSFRALVSCTCAKFSHAFFITQRVHVRVRVCVCT